MSNPVPREKNFAGSRATASVGIFAHNEERLVRDVVAGFIAQRTRAIDITQILVVSCGSTDRTAEYAAEAGKCSPLVQLVDRPYREGKAKAIEVFRELAHGDIVIVSGADTIPTPDAVELLGSALMPPIAAGMAGGQIRPIQTPQTLVQQLHALQWELHHLVARSRPKLGEIVAIRRDLLRSLPNGVHCDEVALEWMVSTAGFGLHYEEALTAHNASPASLRSFYRQRRRIACQHQAAVRYLHYTPSTVPIRAAQSAAWELARAQPANVPALLFLSALEILCRAHGYLDYRRGDRYVTWPNTREAGMILRNRK